MIRFTFKDNKYYKDNKEIDKVDIENILNKSQLKKLYNTGECNIRKSTIENKVSKDVKLLNKFKDNYRTSSATYRKTGFVYELYRKHPRYGFWQMVCYIDNLEEETVNAAIIKDIKEQALIRKNKSKK